MSDGFKLEKYHDEYRERVQAMLDEKSKGQEITIAAPEAPRHGQIIDLMQALQAEHRKSEAQAKGRTGPAQAKNCFVEQLPRFESARLSFSSELLIRHTSLWQWVGFCNRIAAIVMIPGRGTPPDILLSCVGIDQWA